MRLKNTVTITAANDGKSEMVLVGREDHERMIRLFFALRASARQLLHHFPMHHASPPRHDLRHFPSLTGPNQGHVGSPVLRDHLDMLPDVPADFSSPVGLLYELPQVNTSEYKPFNGGMSDV